MARSYFILAVRENIKDNFVWVVSFGDYNKSVVEDEKQDLKDQGYKNSNMKIIKLESAKQVLCDAAIDSLNSLEVNHAS